MTIKFLAVAATVALTASFALTACEDTPPEEKKQGTDIIDNPNDDPNTGVPAEGTRLVDKIVSVWESERGSGSNRVTESHTDVQTFRYDSRGRVVRVESGDTDDSYITTISYGANSITVTLENFYVWDDGYGARDTRATATRGLEPNNGDQIRDERIFTYNLNSVGHVASLENFVAQAYINGVAWREEGHVYEENGSWSYNNGYIDSGAWGYREEYNTDSGMVIQTRETTSDYVWADGNLTSIASSAQYTHQSGDNEPREGTEEQEVALTYSSKANPASNLDLNMMVYSIFDDGFSDMLGFGGKRSANLISGYNYGSGSTTPPYTVIWETDSNGYVTKLTTNQANEYASSRHTYTVTYRD